MTTRENADLAKAVGFEYPAKPISWNKRDLLIYANAVGAGPDELQFLYEFHPKFAAFPTYPMVLSFKGTSQDTVDYYKSSKAISLPGVPELDYRRVVDGERFLEQVRPLPVSSEGKRFEIRTKCLGVYDKGSGLVIETESSIVDVDSGLVYTRMVNSGFAVGQGGLKNQPKGTKKKSYVPPKNTPPTLVELTPTTINQALLYRLNGDYNPLHADPSIAPKMGFKGAILHGLNTWAIAAHAALKNFGASDQSRFVSFEARFSKPVYPGDTLETLMWKIGEKNGLIEVVLIVRAKERNEIVLSNGHAVLKASSDSKL